MTIGRGSFNEIIIKDLEVSKIHAKIIWERVYWENSFYISDLGSTNGTFVNNERLSEAKVKSVERKVMCK